VSVAPGKEMVLDEVKLPTANFGTGKFTVQYERVFGKSYQGTLEADPTLKELGTGKLDLEIKSPDAEKKGKEKKDQDKEAFTARGKEINGLQAGLGLGEHRAYATGETVTLVVRVRNVSKEAVKFHYVPKFFFETPPTVTDGEGKPVMLGGKLAVLGEHPHVDVDLAPGTEIVLKELKLQLKPVGDDGKMSYSAGFEHTLQGIGKFNLQYEQVLHDSSSGKATNDPALSKLGTGKLELEVKEAVKTAVLR
jgi:hypothetical protein